MSGNLEKIKYALPQNIYNMLKKIPESKFSFVNEIRIRSYLPLSLIIGTKIFYVRQTGEISENFFNAYICTKTDIDETFIRLCKNSVYAHEKELKDGFIIMNYGCRAGVGGTYDGNIPSDISSVNIRIAHEIIGISDSVYPLISKKSLLIAGPPASGKTTLLRDIIRQNSNDKMTVSVIDSRGEISASVYGKAQNDLGKNTDVLITESKDKGIEIALRTLNPDIIAFDEIGTNDELEKIYSCFNSGVLIMTTAHVGDIGELTRRSITGSLIKNRIVNNIILLSKDFNIKPKIYDCEEIISDFY